LSRDKKVEVGVANQIRHYLRTHREGGFGAGNSTEAINAANLKNIITPREWV
jgi:hypothetical protein